MVNVGKSGRKGPIGAGGGGEGKEEFGPRRSENREIEEKIE